MSTIIRHTPDDEIGYASCIASSHSPLTEHQVYEICGWLLGGEEARNAAMEDDRKE